MEPGNCLLGKYPQNLKVTLLEIDQAEIWTSYTREPIDYQGEISSFSVTPVFSAPRCGEGRYYGIAILDSIITNYEIVKLERISDDKKIQSLDRIVRSTTVLEKLRTNITKETYEPEGLPEVFLYPMPEIETFVVSYEGGYPGIFGPRVVLINGSAYPLTGWCSYPYMGSFRLNGDYYIESGSLCCECGITLMELFRIRPTAPVKVHSDGSLSD